jgi:hypothetical protein
MADSGVIFDHISPATHGGYRVSVQVLQVSPLSLRACRGPC